MTVQQLIDRLTASIALDAKYADRNIFIIDDGSTFGVIEAVQDDSEDIVERYGLDADSIIFETDTHDLSELEMDKYNPELQ
jgi:hypothetical protein